MRRSIPLWGALAAAAPLAITSPDSSVTTAQLLGGTGSYAEIARGCNNEVLSREKLPYSNAGAELSHKFPGPVQIGARAGTYKLERDTEATRYVNPYLSLEWRAFSLGGGVIGTPRGFPGGAGSADDHRHYSAHIRIGSRTGYFSTSYMEGVPILTGGYYQFGVGGGGRREDIWGGLGIGPYDKLGAVLKFDYRILGGLGVSGVGRLGSSEGVSENSFALGLSFRGVHHGAGEPVPAPPPEPAITPPPADTVRPGSPPADSIAPIPAATDPMPPR